MNKVPFTFTWPSLKTNRDIRLLKLHPGSPSDEIKTSLAQIGSWQLPDVTPYEALSYAWESSECTKSITCNGTNLPITRNLHSALRHLRPSASHRYLWVDAICIDQTSTVERSSQILLMREIFHNAFQVIGWIGEEADDSASAMDVDFKGAKYQEVAQHLDQFVTEQQFDAFYHVFCRPWFTRVWMVQEVALAREAVVQCGHDTMSWKNLDMALCLLSDRLYRSQSDHTKSQRILGTTRFVAVRHEIQRRSHVSPEVAYEMTRPYQSTDPKDKFYSILGLLGESERSAVKPDYNLSAAEVFSDVARTFIERSGSLFFLSLSRPVHPRVVLGGEDEPSEGLTTAQSRSRQCPSWAVDWSRPDPAFIDPEPQQLDDELNAFRASGSTKAVLHRSQNSKSIMLSGKVIGTIKSCARAFQLDVVAQTLHTHPRHSMEKISLLACLETQSVSEALHPSDSAVKAKYVPTGQTIAEAHWRTLIANRWYHPVQGAQATPPPDAFSDIATAWVRLMQADDPTQRYRWTTVENDKFSYSSLMESQQDPQGHQRDRRYYQDKAMERMPSLFWKAMQAGVVGRCFCVIGDQYMGLAAPAAKEGDVVVVLYGGNVPYVLRGIRSGSKDEQQWELVGEAYVHGMMEGEVLRRTDLPDRLFIIS